MSTEEQILRMERKLLQFGRTDRADYIVHCLNLLYKKLAREKGEQSNG